MEAIDVLRQINVNHTRKLPIDAPTHFIKRRWSKLVLNPTGIDPRYYELCALSELKNALRSGDIWVQGSRQFKDFDDYLIPLAQFKEMQQQDGLSLPVQIDSQHYLEEQVAQLHF